LKPASPIYCLIRIGKKDLTTLHYVKSKDKALSIYV
jgi:hypothetical protein